MADDIIIGVHLTPAQYRSYERIAAARATQVHRLIEQLAVRAITPKRRRVSNRAVVDHDELRRLRGQGLNDREIGERMGFSGSTIQSHRDDMGLPKHGRQGRPKKSDGEVAA